MGDDDGWGKSSRLMNSSFFFVLIPYIYRFGTFTAMPFESMKKQPFLISHRGPFQKLQAVMSRVYFIILIKNWMKLNEEILD